MPTIHLPVFHSGQRKIWENRSKFNALQCGRRFGKTMLAVAIVCDSAARGKQVGFFAPTGKQWSEVYDDCLAVLEPLLLQHNRTNGYITTKTKGKLDFWSTNDNFLAGRGRAYDTIVIDEAAYTKTPEMLDEIWKKSIKPTLWTTNGTVWVMSTPQGVDSKNFFYSICNDTEHGFTVHHAPTHDNPLISKEILDAEALVTHPLVWEQEALAKFVDWTGLSFFDISKCLQDGNPTQLPRHCDAVFAVVDTATKTGRDHDGTAVCFFSINTLGIKILTLLDWDIVQIEGALLEVWLPTIFQKLSGLSELCGARNGSIGCWIEDKASGMVLLQQSARRGWAARAINSKLTSVGKDERAISVSGYVYQGLFKISDQAYTKTTSYKDRHENHFLKQFFGYKLGQKDQSDDLFDAACYGIAISLGNNEGF